MMYPVKKLERNELSKVQDLEKKMNCCIIAFDALPKPASLSSAQLDELKGLEKDTGAVMIAYKCQPSTATHYPMETPEEG